MAHGVDARYVWEHTKEFAGKAFYELINFSDCEGTIGPATSGKLYRDFVTFDEQAKLVEMYGMNSYFYEKYQEWKEAFRVASDENGAVAFH